MTPVNNVKFINYRKLVWLWHVFVALMSYVSTFVLLDSSFHSKFCFLSSKTKFWDLAVATVSSRFSRPRCYIHSVIRIVISMMRNENFSQFFIKFFFLHFAQPKILSEKTIILNVWSLALVILCIWSETTCLRETLPRNMKNVIFDFNCYSLAFWISSIKLLHE